MSLLRNALLAALVFGVACGYVGPLQAAKEGTLAKGANDSEEEIVRREILEKTKDLGFELTTIPPAPDVAAVRAWAEAKDKKLYNRKPMGFSDYQRNPPKDFLASLPLVIDVSVSEEYVWDIEDVRALSKALGYEAKNIPGHCQLRLNALFTSDKGSYTARLFSGGNTSLRFDGTLQKIGVSPWAVCDRPEGVLPQQPNLIGWVGKDKYSVSLSDPAECALPKGENTLKISYTGNGKVTCLWTVSP